MGTIKSDRLLNIVLWFVQCLVAVILLTAGLIKLTTPMETLAKQLPWTGSSSLTLVYATAFADILGGLGVIFPGMMRIKPVLIVYSAFGVVMLMAASVIFHLQRGESGLIGFNVLLLFLAVFLVLGRTRRPISE